jgi:adenosylcobinamide-GDP ribazoletransferase
MTNPLLTALGFLTVLPLRRRRALPAARDIPWLPAAGLVLGLVWALFDLLIGRVMGVPLLLRAVLDVLLLAALTGGLHLDGLADTADGLLSHRGPERALEIMRDSRTGVWGALALCAVLLLKVAALHAVLQAAPWYAYAAGLLLTPALGRAAMLPAVALLPYGRGEDGLGFGLFRDASHWTRTWLPVVLLLALAPALLPLQASAAMAAAWALCLTLMLRWYAAGMGCVTGDMLGALVECSETAALVGLALAL